MMKKDIFKLARAYRFEKVKRCVQDSSDINRCDKNGESVLKLFLAGYYEYCRSLNNGRVRYTEKPDSYVPDWIKIPLASRKSGILSQLEWFLNKGADVNLCDLAGSVIGAVDTPLCASVLNHDYYMTEFLLEHGADPGIITNDVNLGKPKDYYLINRMDVETMQSEGERLENELRIIALLAGHGLADYEGHNIKIDRENSVVTGYGITEKF